MKDPLQKSRSWEKKTPQQDPTEGGAETHRPPADKAGRPSPGPHAALRDRRAPTTGLASTDSGDFAACASPQGSARLSSTWTSRAPAPTRPWPEVRSELV